MTNASCPLEDVGAAAQPEAKHFKRLAEAGYKTVLDLRIREEPRGVDEPEVVRGAGMEYVNIPVSPETLGDEAFGRDASHPGALLERKPGGSSPASLPYPGGGKDARRGLGDCLAGRVAER
ncbi:MAG: hypothetical protein H0V53_10530 [Rubrobacter sp.]|nr:hypothetical protein [Rubrobacter sp.]